MSSLHRSTSSTHSTRETNNNSSTQSSPTTSSGNNNDTLSRDFSLISLDSTLIDPDVFKNTEHASQTLRALLNCFKSKELCDVILVAEGKR